MRAPPREKSRGGVSRSPPAPGWPRGARCRLRAPLTARGRAQQVASAVIARREALKSAAPNLMDAPGRGAPTAPASRSPAPPRVAACARCSLRAPVAARTTALRRDTLPAAPPAGLAGASGGERRCREGPTLGVCAKGNSDPYPCTSVLGAAGPRGRGAGSPRTRTTGGRRSERRSERRRGRSRLVAWKQRLSPITKRRVYDSVSERMRQSTTQ